jgi:TonB-linked SusC/RagA family outer membrane protein
MKKILFAIYFVGFFAVSTVFAQNRIVTGSVVAADDGGTVPGVTIAIKGTSQGTVSDVDGKFRISAKTGDVLQIKFIGYVTAEIPIVDGVSVYTVKLAPENRLLTEVVVTDTYGAQLKKSYTGSATTVSGKVNENKPFTTTMQSLQGEVAGLNVTNNSGQPGADVQVHLRGIGSIGAGSNPLYVIDGTIINSGDLSTLTTTANVLAGINNDDIASISVLKDAAATAIYGSRGSNGVIIITTKKGRSGKTDVEASAELGNTTDLPLPEAGQPLTGPEFKTLTLEGLRNAGADAGTINYYKQLYNGRSNNWYDIVTRNGSQSQYNISASGGNDDTKIFASGGYFHQTSTTIASSLTRVTSLVNIDHNISKRISMSASINVSNVNQYTPTNGGAFANPIGSAFFLTPFQTAYNKDGSININPNDYPNGISNYNPVYIAANDRNYLSQTRLLGNLSLKWNIVSTLKFTSFVGLDDNILEENVFNNPIMGDGVPNGSGSDNYSRYFNYIVRQQFDYRWNITKGNDDLYLDLTAGYEVQKDQDYFVQTNTTLFPATQPTLRATANASTPILGDAFTNANSGDSFYSRGVLNYKNLFSLSGSFRRDGSSVFSADGQFGNFYSIGGAWNIDQQDFFAKQSIFSSAKIRSSYGLTGNRSGLSSYGALTTAGYGNNYAGSPGQNFNTIGNPYLTWETSHKFDVGADFGFLKDRLTFSIDYYRDNIDGLILAVPLALETGFASQTSNVGAMLNRGFEISITGIPVKTKDFTWQTDFNIATNRNTVTKLYNNQPFDYDNVFYASVGKDLQTFYAPAFAGVDPANGEVLWYTDASKKTTTDNYEDAARIQQYQADPKAFGGFTNTFTYKGLTLSAEIYYNVGNHIYDSWSPYFYDGQFNTEVNKYQYTYEHRWTHPGQITDVPQYVDGGTNNGEAANISSRFLYKGDFARFKNLTIGYDFKDDAFLKSLGISKFYLYCRGTNLFTKTFDKRLPFDPEVGLNGQSNLEVPQVETFTIGLNVGL